MSTKLFGMKNKVKKVTVDSVKEAAIEVKVELESKELRMNKITKENFLGIANKIKLPEGFYYNEKNWHIKDLKHLNLLQT